MQPQHDKNENGGDISGEPLPGGSESGVIVFGSVLQITPGVLTPEIGGGHRLYAVGGGGAGAGSGSSSGGATCAAAASENNQQQQQGQQKPQQHDEQGLPDFVPRSPAGTAFSTSPGTHTTLKTSRSRRSSIASENDDAIQSSLRSTNNNTAATAAAASAAAASEAAATATAPPAQDGLFGRLSRSSASSSLSSSGSSLNRSRSNHGNLGGLSRTKGSFNAISKQISGRLNALMDGLGSDSEDEDSNEPVRLQNAAKPPARPPPLEKRLSLVVTMHTSGGLFRTVQMMRVFHDSKFFVDCVARLPPKNIEMLWQQLVFNAQKSKYRDRRLAAAADRERKIQAGEFQAEDSDDDVGVNSDLDHTTDDEENEEDFVAQGSDILSPEEVREFVRRYFFLPVQHGCEETGVAEALSSNVSGINEPALVRAAASMMSMFDDTEDQQQQKGSDGGAPTDSASESKALDASPSQDSDDKAQDGSSSSSFKTVEEHIDAMWERLTIRANAPPVVFSSAVMILDSDGKRHQLMGENSRTLLKSEHSARIFAAISNVAIEGVDLDAHKHLTVPDVGAVCPVSTTSQAQSEHAHDGAFLQLPTCKIPRDDGHVHDARSDAAPDQDAPKATAQDDGIVDRSRHTSGAQCYVVAPNAAYPKFYVSDKDTLIPLIKPYVVPGGRFRELYYWDSYFTLLGLLQAGRVALAVGMVENFAHLIATYDRVPNGNRAYYLSRSQPPFFVMMLQLLENWFGTKAVARRYRHILMREYKWWTYGHKTLSSRKRQARRVVAVEVDVHVNKPSAQMNGSSTPHKNDGNEQKDHSHHTHGEQENGSRLVHEHLTILSRYFDGAATPRPESHVEDVDLVHERGLHPRSPEGAALLRHVRAAAESGWDFSSRWMEDEVNFSSINTTDIIPVDLNCLLYQMEVTLARYYVLDVHRPPAPDNMPPRPGAWPTEGKAAEFEFVSEPFPVPPDNQRGSGSVVSGGVVFLCPAPSTSAKFADAAALRLQAMHKFLWDDERGFFFDYNWAHAKRSNIWSLAGATPLFFGVASPQQASRVATHVREKFLQAGGFVTTWSAEHSEGAAGHPSKQQWDAPNGWAPLQWMVGAGLAMYGYRRLACIGWDRWQSLVRRVFQRTSLIMEKYDVVDMTRLAGGGEYDIQSGFGWTNGVHLAIMAVLQSGLVKDDSASELVPDFGSSCHILGSAAATAAAEQDQNIDLSDGERFEGISLKEMKAWQRLGLSLFGHAHASPVHDGQSNPVRTFVPWPPKE